MSPIANRTDVAAATGPELVEFYNLHADTPVKRFSNLATGRRRVLELMDALDETLDPANADVPSYEIITMVASEPAQPSATRSEAISESWNDNEVRAKRRQRSAVEVGGERYRSVKAAFEALSLPLEKHIAFRIRLKEKGSLQSAFGHDWKIIPLNY